MADTKKFTETINGAQLLIKLLEHQGIDVIAGIPGGANLPMYDALYESSIRHILVRHEQAAGFFAQGISRTTGKAAVCFATSGPGATNALTAIADAKLDSIPIVCITGQVSYSLVGTDAFQEVDTYGLTLPITKHNFLVRDVMELFEVIPEAFRIAVSGRPGPVVVDIPKDVQLQAVGIYELPDIFKPKEEEIEDIETLKTIEDAAQMINESKRPVLYIGGGVINADASGIITEIAEKNSIPVACTLMGLGAISPENPLYLGMLGMHGARYTNYLLHEADLIIALGVRFDDRATGKVDTFCPNATIIHFDIDNAEINKVKRADINIVGGLKPILHKLAPSINKNDRIEWIGKFNDLKKKHPFVMPPETDLFHPLTIIKELGNILSDDDIVATDVGQHQMWTAQGYPVRKPRTFLTSGGLGTMGFGLPTAIGAAMANPDKKVVCISGDGSILMNIQEFATLADLQSDLKVIIMNNGHLGLVRQQQEMIYNKHYIASKFDSSPDFAAIAKGFGIKGVRVDKDENPIEIIRKCISEPGPCVIDVPVRPEENVVPIVPPGKANYEMIGGEL
ncbi:biosynthetic-type acetolactate synthase large subunit [Pseudobacteroides cellulosolvens]|uniref:Acetolactate synthase n=1 Tax=Pseudobacteroides cellulosolvens ATCC 35603 = DSM 2933 TaxID=398512 RepID=A0A0L6JKG1_9FIRM|nr:biosynthetic-type acetolactate synthase large subunit [Pseudobacteroides cellulosolvens]KNY26240.1 acetolactate synthase, large subunit, biosynthetic type [Pseudobacteroides cellulosolvens ATCC 35603 = DSM 2933]